MTSDLLTAIKTYALGAAPFNGTPQTVAGPWWQQEPPAATFPYARFIVVGAGQDDWFAGAISLEQVRVRFDVFHTDNNLAFTYANQISARFTNASLTLNNGTCVGTLPAALPYAVPVPPTIKDAAGNPVYHVVTDIRFWLA